MFQHPDYPYGLLNLQFLDSVGDGTGSIEMNVDGSVTPQEFSIICPPGHKLQIETISTFLQDAGTFTAEEYGNVPALTNGIKLELRRTVGVAEITIQQRIKTNSDWMAYAFNMNNFDFAGGQSVLAVSYSLNDAGRPIQLSAGESFVAVVSDNISTLTKHFMRLTYVLIPTT